MSKNNMSLLWSISHPDFKAPCYIFGTMHVKDNRAFRGIESIKLYIRQCNIFATEFDINEANNTDYMDAIVLEDGQKLSQLFKPKMYSKIDHLFHKYTGHNLTEFDFFKPIAITNLITEAQFKAQQNESLDDTLYQFAQYEGKKNIGLETFQFQLDLLKEIPLDSQIRSLKKTVNNFDVSRQHIKQTLKAYYKGDIKAIYKQVKKSKSPQRKILLNKRNISMIERIYELSKKDTAFIAIGAAHLGGGKGVLQGLIKKGCTIEAIKY